MESEILCDKPEQWVDEGGGEKRGQLRHGQDKEGGQERELVELS